MKTRDITDAVLSGRKSHWDKVYTTRSPLEVSWYQEDPRLSLELIERCGLAPDAPIIDVGGGASVLVDRLLDAGHRQVAVLDISAAALDVARRRLHDRADRVEWFEADITAFEAPHPFSLWHDRAVFHFLTAPRDREQYARVLARTVPPGGHVIMATFALGGPTQCSNLDIEQYDADKLLATLGPGLRLVEHMHETHMTPAGKPQLFSVCRMLRV